MFIWGGSGTGKTIVALEILKTKVSHFKWNEKPVKVIVTQYGGGENDETPLKENMKRQLINVKKEVISLQKLCIQHGVDYNEKQRHPKDLLNEITQALGAFYSDSDHHVLFLCDEVPACTSGGQTSADWRDVSTPANVTWIYSIKPESDMLILDMNDFTPPTNNEKILTKKLLHSHRNSYQIRSVSTKCIFKYKH